MKYKKCLECGKVYETDDYRRKYCSVECRNKVVKRKSQLREKIIKNDPDALKLRRDYARERYRNKTGYKPPVCLICGDTIKDSSKAKYHLECLLNKIAAAENGYEREKWRHILRLRGYLAEEIHDMLNGLNEKGEYKDES